MTNSGLISSTGLRMRALRLTGLLLVTAWLLFPGQAHAHADLLALIDGVTKRIVDDPKNASLYFLRGELYRAHADWKLAREDYDQATQIDPNFADVELARGKLAFDLGNDQEAKTRLDAFLKSHSEDLDAFVTRAHILVRLGDRKKAAADLSSAIEHSPNPRPDYFLERATLQAEEGDRVAAIKGLDEGLSKLGPLVALQLQAIDLECEQKQFDDALKRLEAIATNSDHRERWLIRRGEILLLAGRREPARSSFVEGLAMIDSLPPRARTAPATLELKKRASDGLATLDSLTTVPLSLNH